MKKIISLLLSLVIISSMAVFADDAALTEEYTMPTYTTSYGEITETAEGYIVVNTADGEVRFNYDDSTYIIDAETVLPLNLDDRTSDKVIVTRGMATTMSIPPQSFAYAIIGNVTEELGNPVYTEVEDVRNGKDGITIITENGMKEITVPATADVAPYLTKNIVTIDDITKGSKVLLWYDILTASIPAYGSSDRVVILSQGNIPETGLYVNGVAITLNEDEEPYMDGETQMLPLRTVAETLGCEVTWYDETMSVKVEKGDVSSTFSVISDDAKLRTASVNAVLKNDKTYVSADFFEIFAD